MDKRLLSILCCPVTHKGLSQATGELLRDVNNAIKSGRLQNRGGETLSAALRDALVTDDGKILYPIDDDIPVLLEDESVMLDQLDPVESTP